MHQFQDIGYGLVSKTSLRNIEYGYESTFDLFDSTARVGDCSHSHNLICCREEKQKIKPMHCLYHSFEQSLRSITIEISDAARVCHLRPNIDDFVNGKKFIQEKNIEFT